MNYTKIFQRCKGSAHNKDLHFDHISVLEENIRLALQGWKMTHTVVDGYTGGKRNTLKKTNKNKRHK